MAGVAPMSLMTYADAFPWGEAVRAEVIGHMPPWHAQEGTSSIVRNATISVKATRTADVEQVLAVRVPGEDPVDPEGAALVVRMHYEKTFSYEERAITDRSAAGVYFSQDPSIEIRRAVTFAPVSATRDPVFFNRRVTEDLQALAFRPDASLTNAMLSWKR